MGIRRLPGPIRLLAAGTLVSSAGASLMWPLVTLYVHNVLHHSVAAAGLVLMLQALASMVGQLAGGVLYDRAGGKAPLVAAMAAAAAVCAALAAVQAWWGYIALMTAFGLAFGTAQAPINALVAAIWPEAGRDAFNVLYVTNNVGVAAGAALGGILAERSFPLTFAGAAAGFLVYGLLVAVALAEPARRSHAATPQLPWRGLGDLRAVAALAAGVVLANAAYSQWQSAVAVDMTAQGLSTAAYGALWTLNGILVIALQPLASAVVRHTGRRLDRQLLASAGLYAAGFLSLLLVRGYAAFLAGMALMTAGEVFERPASPALMAQLAPPGREGVYQGLVGSFLGGGRMVGPLLGGLLYDAAGPATLWLASVGACGVAGGAYASLARAKADTSSAA